MHATEEDHFCCRWYLPGLHELVFNVTTLEETSGLETLKLGGLLHAKDFIEQT